MKHILLLLCINALRASSDPSNYLGHLNQSNLNSYNYTPWKEIVTLIIIFIRHGVHFKLFANDTQFYMTLNNVDNEGKLSSIMSNIGKWMDSKQLKLN